MAQCVTVIVTPTVPMQSTSLSSSLYVHSLTSVRMTNLIVSPTQNDIAFRRTKTAVAIYCSAGVMLLLLMILITVLTVVCYVRRKRQQDNVKMGKRQIYIFHNLHYFLPILKFAFMEVTRHINSKLFSIILS